MGTDDDDDDDDDDDMVGRRWMLMTRRDGSTDGSRVRREGSLPIVKVQGSRPE